MNIVAIVLFLLELFCLIGIYSELEKPTRLVEASAIRNRLIVLALIAALHLLLTNNQ